MTNTEQQVCKYFMVITNVSGTHLTWNYVCYIMDFKHQLLLKDMETSYSTHADISSYL